MRLSRVECAGMAVMPMAIAACLALRLPPETLGLIGLVAMLRLGWVDDNIASDLVDAQALPAAYSNARQRRRMAIWALFGLRMAPPSDISPLMLATRYRAEAQVWQVMLWTAFAVGAGLAVPLPFGAALFAFGYMLAWQQMGHLFAALVAISEGRALGREALLRRARWANSLPERRRSGGLGRRGGGQ